MKNSTLFAVFIISLLITASCKAPEENPDRPNIILLMSDDQGWHETGYNGHEMLLTPVLDEMAAKGLRFNRFYSGASVCTPTRASVMTGRHPNRSGAFVYNYSTRPEEISIAQILHDAGYSTAHFGKWHLGPVKKSSPTSPGSMGFDHWLSHDNFFSYNPPLVLNGADPEIYKGESSEILVEEAMNWLGKVSKGKKPFFLVIWFGSPHEPYAGIDADIQPYIKNKVLKHRFAEITAMDRSIGWLRDYLKANGISDNTLIWFNSDNGVPRDSNFDTKLRGHKGNFYENGIRVPAIIEWPSFVREPAVSDVPCVTSDILPTLCDFLKLDLPDRELDGISLVPLINGQMKQRPEPICFWRYDFRKEAAAGNPPWLDAALQKGTTPTNKRNFIQFENYTHPLAKTESFGGFSAIMDNRYKLVNPESGVFELYDIIDDPYETEDIAAAYPEILGNLKTKLNQWQVSVEISLTGAEY